MPQPYHEATPCCFVEKLLQRTFRTLPKFAFSVILAAAFSGAAFAGAHGCKTYAKDDGYYRSCVNEEIYSQPQGIALFDTLENPGVWYSFKNTDGNIVVYFEAAMPAVYDPRQAPGPDRPDDE